MKNNYRRLTAQKFKLLMDLGLWSGSYHHPKIQKQYQERDRNQDPVNRHDGTSD